MATAEIDEALSGRRILLLTASALAVALLILFGGILPAEYDRDPTGIGHLIGTAELWAPEEQVLSPKGTAAAAPRQRPEAIRRPSEAT